MFRSPVRKAAFTFLAHERRLTVMREKLGRNFSFWAQESENNLLLGALVCVQLKQHG